MRRRHPGKCETPRLWLVSDARNDALLEPAIARLPHGSGLIFRHFHLADNERRARFERLARLIHKRGGMAVLAGDVQLARRWRADGIYGPPGGGPADGLIRLVNVHDMREVRRANMQEAVLRRTSHTSRLMLISPVFATRTHPGDRTLGIARFSALARHAKAPVIALGGVTCARARQMAGMIDGWAAIDGLSS